MNTTLRFGRLVYSAEIERARRLEAVLHAVEVAETDDELLKANAELATIARLADAEYGQRIERAVVHMNTGGVDGSPCGRTEAQLAALVRGS